MIELQIQMRPKLFILYLRVPIGVVIMMGLGMGLDGESWSPAAVYALGSSTLRETYAYRYLLQRSIACVNIHVYTTYVCVLPGIYFMCAQGMYIYADKNAELQL